MREKEYSVSEAVQLTGVPSHVLRYWEEELQITIKRTNLGHRVYSDENLQLFRQVKEWKEKGIQLKAIRALLRGEYRDSEFVGQVREILQEGGAEKTVCAEPEEVAYDVIITEQKTDNLQQFGNILKQIMKEVAAEQNEQLEQALVHALREELEDLYIQQIQMAVREAAVSRTQTERSVWKRLKKVLKRE